MNQKPSDLLLSVIDFFGILIPGAILVFLHGDYLLSRLGLSMGTHKGPFMGMPPTGKSWSVPIHITYQVRDGKIVEHWIVIDTVAFMQQLGLMPSTEAAA